MFANKRLFVLLASLIILVALIGYSMKQHKQTMPEQFIRDTVGWFQSVLYKPAHLTAGFFGNISDMKKVYDQNKVLKSHLGQYGEMHQKISDLQKKNKELKDVLHKTKDPDLSDYNIIQSQIIARSPDAWNKQITINKGTKNGVKEDMAVITSKGMIGKIVSVNPFSSTVQLVSNLDRSNLISAVIQDHHDIHGMVGGYDPKKKALLFKLIPFDAKLKKGQTVITSGLGGVFPSGLIIGKVKDVSPDPQGLTKIAYVKPSADLQDIYNVMVIDRKALSPKKSGAK